MKKVWLLILALCLLAAPLTAQGEECGLYIPKVDLPEDFMMGMDVSSVLALEKSGVKYYDHQGQERDLFAILAENGINTIRVRVWNDPFTADGKGYGGGNCDINTAIEIGKRATANGMKLLVDFHYSDFWADPGKQMAPKAWDGMKLDAKIEAVYNYTFDCLTQLKEAGVDVGMVQLGNETNGMLCGKKIWRSIYKLMDAGSRATRAVDPEILIAVHFANPENAENYESWSFKLDYYHLDYDVFATSYYPYWHGTLENLKNVLSYVQQTYGKKVMVVETSYAYTAEDTDFSGNTIGEGGSFEKPYPFTVQGQANEVADVVKAMADIGGIGVCYWEGAWITVGQQSFEENSALWETYGSGWASSTAAEYDPKDAGVYYGGSACDNQAMFGPDGKALESLKVFRLLRMGNQVPVVPDAIEDVHLELDLAGEIKLPETVNAIMNDGSRREISVVWDAYDAAAMKAGGVQDYVIMGKADGMDAVCHVSMVQFNYLQNAGFEDGEDGTWVATDLRQTEQLYVEEKKSDSLSGVKHYHFYSANAGSVEFTLEQQVTGLPAGTYRYEIAIMGGDGGQTEIYSYVKINGEEVARKESGITSYNNWDIPVIEGMQVKEGDVVTVGMYVKCSGAGKGAWGKIDDAKLNLTAAQ